MKYARAMGWKKAVGAALALALGAVGSAQSVGKLTPNGGGSLANDVIFTPAMEAPRPSFWGEIGVELDSTMSASLELGVQLAAGPEIDANAIFPVAEDLSTIVTLSGGAPGSVGMILIGRIAAPVQPSSFSKAAVFSGTFGPSGQFEVVLPPHLDVRGFGAMGAAAPSGMATQVVVLDEAIPVAFADWQRLSGLAKPQGARPETKPAQHAGRLGQVKIDANGRVVSRPAYLDEEELEETYGMQKLGELARPQGARPETKPAQHGGRLGQVKIDANGPVFSRPVEIEKTYGTQKLGELANPEQVRSSDSLLRRRPRHGGHLGR